MNNLRHSSVSRIIIATYNTEDLNKVNTVPLIEISGRTIRNSIVAGTMLMSFVLSSNTTPTINPFLQNELSLICKYNTNGGAGSPVYKTIDDNQDNKVTITVLSDGAYSYNMIRELKENDSYKELLGVKNMRKLHLNNVTNNEVKVAGILGKKFRNDDIEINERRQKEEQPYVKVVASAVYAGDMPKKRRV